MFYLDKNVNILIQGSGIFANQAQLSVQSDLSPLYLSENRHSFDYKAGNGIGGVLSLSYYLTGYDPLKAFLAEEQTVLSGNFGGLNFNSGYLKTYNLNCQPNRSSIVNAEIIFFDDLKGSFKPSYNAAPELSFLNFSNATITDPTNGNIGSISNAVGLTYSFNSEINPLFLAGETTPNRITFGIKDITATIVTDNLSGDLPISGKSAGIEIFLEHPFLAGIGETFGISGALFQRNLNVGVGQKLQSTLSIKQNYINSAPSIFGFSPASASPGSLIAISGTSLSQISSLFFGDSVSNFYVISDNLISGVVPNDVVNGRLTLNGYGGITSSTGYFNPVQNPIQISGITPISSPISGIIRVSGNNFYRISDVSFNTGQSATYSVISPTLIEVKVPEFAARGKLWISSKDRGISGLSPQSFVPVPNIFKFTPTFGNTGDSVIIEGRGFSGVTGVLFNNLPNVSPFTSLVSVLSNTGISAIVPTGNFKGYITLIGASGVQSLSADEFLPSVAITGLNPTSARTGTSIEILGTNFYRDILFPINLSTNSFLAGFGSSTASGEFIRVSSTKLTGIVPYGATSGPVFLYDADGNPYPLTGNFVLRNNAPLITSTGTQTGFYPNYAVIEGTDLLNVSSISLSGATGVLPIQSSTIYSSQLGNTVSFQLPEGTGGYYNVAITTSEGAVTGINSIFLRTIPILRTITPASGGVGAIIGVSGQNIYPDSRIFINNTGVESTVVSQSVPTGFNFIQFYIPTAAQTGFNNVLLYNQRGWITGISGFKLIDSPQISGFAPISGTFGDLVSISGRFLGNVTGIVFGSGQANTFSLINNTGATVTVPNNATTDLIKLQYNGGDVYSTGLFTVLTPNISITSIIPSGYWLDTAWIRGNNLDSVVSVDISGAPVTGFNLFGITGIYFQIPIGAQTGPVTLQSDRMSVTSTNNLTILQGPFISGFSPSSGIYGDTIQITGSSLSGCSFLFPTLVNGRYITGNNTVFIGNTGATVKVPREIINGSIVLSGANRIWAGSSGIFLPIPTIAKFSPASLLTGATLTLSGINAGSISNSLLFITGNGMARNAIATNLSVNYNQITGAGVVNPSTGYSVITATINTDFARSGALFLVNTGFNINSLTDLLASPMAKIIDFRTATGNLTITQSGPVIQSFTPVLGGSNTLVSLSGANLSTTTGVYLISGASQVKCNLISSGLNLITFNPVAFTQKSGQFKVVTDYGSATSSQYFTVINTPFISGFFPTQGPTGTQIMISGSGIEDTRSFWIDVSPTISHSGSFVLGQIGTIPVLTGTIPHIYSNLERTIAIRLVNDAGTGIASGQFFLHPGETQFWGNLSGSKLIGATGLSIIESLGQPLASGAIFTINSLFQNGLNYSVVNMLYKGQTTRVFSFTTGS